MENDNALGIYLKDRRRRLDPVALGFELVRRRTPGLRREEVAQRAKVSATWYTWLEQGRGGQPSSAALERIASALELTTAEREQLFVLARRYMPEPAYEPPDCVTSRLRRVLDTLTTSPAYVRNSAADLVAWNSAAVAVFTDYALIAPEERNILRLLFCNEAVRAKMPNWETDARFSVEAFRLETTRVGMSGRVAEVVDALCRDSDEFRSMWAEQDVSTYSEGTKHIVHPQVGAVALEYTAFAAIGQPDLCMVIYTPSMPADFDKVRALLADRHL